MSTLIRCALAAVFVTLLPGCAPQRGSITQVESTLDAFHQAAADAEIEGYAGRLAPHGVFLGTDATERWTRDEFTQFCEPYFARGRGWEYVPQRRNVSLSPDGRTAWFDEILANDAYGLVRGSGVLTLHGNAWQIEQYNLAFLVPNDVAKDVVALIREDMNSTSPGN